MAVRMTSAENVIRAEFKGSYKPLKSTPNLICVEAINKPCCAFSLLPSYCLSFHYSEGFCHFNHRCLIKILTCYVWRYDRHTCTHDRLTCSYDRLTCSYDRLTCLYDRLTCSYDRHTTQPHLFALCSSVKIYESLSIVLSLFSFLLHTQGRN